MTATLHDAIESVDHALRRGNGRLDLFVGYGEEDGGPCFTLLVSEDQPCDNVMGLMSGANASIAFSQAPTLGEAIVTLADALADAGYKAVSVS